MKTRPDMHSRMTVFYAMIGSALWLAEARAAEQPAAAREQFGRQFRVVLSDYFDEVGTSEGVSQ